MKDKGKTKAQLIGELTVLRENSRELEVLMSGREQKIKERQIVVPVVFLTGHPLGNELEELRAEGLTEWVSKPVTIEKLAELVAQVLMRNN